MECIMNISPHTFNPLLSFYEETEMATKDLAEDFQNQFNDVVSRFQTKQFFQSEWDIVSFAVFFIFIGEWMEFHPKQYHICFPLRRKNDLLRCTINMFPLT